MATSAFAQSITFQWDPHPQASEIQGFKLYASKQSGSYTTPIATFQGGTLTTGTIPSGILGLGKQYFVLTAFVNDIESDRSNEVNTVIKPKAPNVTGVLMVAESPQLQTGLRIKYGE